MKRVCQLVRGRALGHVVRIRANFSILKVGVRTHPSLPFRAQFILTPQLLSSHTHTHLSVSVLPATVSLLAACLSLLLYEQALVSRWKKALGLGGKQNSTKLSGEAKKAAEHARMKMLDRWCYCVDVARVILPGHEFSVRCGTAWVCLLFISCVDVVVFASCAEGARLSFDSGACP